MLTLSDAELQIIFDLARPLELGQRDAFLQAVARELVKYPPEALGPGLIARIVRPLQWQFLRHPTGRETALEIHGGG